MVCLEKPVLETTLATINDLRGNNLEMKNENYRYVGYRQFIWWSGYIADLGKVFEELFHHELFGPYEINTPQAMLTSMSMASAGDPSFILITMASSSNYKK
jgi:hypothetical protein